jgi:outer membrane lipoprotein-sorting protein
MSRQLRAAAVTLAGLFIAGYSAAQTPSADELVAKNLAARGGADKLKGVDSARLVGKMSIQGMETPLTILTKRPNKFRQEMSIQGQKIISAVDGETVWTINPLTGSATPRLVVGPEAEAVKNQSIFDGPLVGYKERGDTLEVVGPADVGGVKTWKLKLTRKGGTPMLIFLDAETNLERQWTARADQNGMTMDFETIMTDYQATDGIMMARSMRTMMGSQQMLAITLTAVEFNVPIADSQFVMPK